MKDERFERVAIQILGQLTTIDERYLTPFLGDDDHHGVGLLAQAEGLAVPRAHIGPGRRGRRERQDHARGGDPALAVDDHGAVVQGRTRMKQRRQQLDRWNGLHGLAALDVVAQPGFPFEHDQRAHAAVGHRERGQRQLVDHVGLLREGQLRAHGRQAHLRQGVADVRLKQHNQDHDGGTHDVFHQPAHRVQIEERGRHIGRSEQHAEPDQHRDRARALDQQQHPINDGGEQGNVDEIGEVKG